MDTLNYKFLGSINYYAGFDVFNGINTDECYDGNNFILSNFTNPPNFFTNLNLNRLSSNNYIISGLQSSKKGVIIKNKIAIFSAYSGGSVAWIDLNQPNIITILHTSISTGGRVLSNITKFNNKFYGFGSIVGDNRGYIFELDFNSTTMPFGGVLVSTSGDNANYCGTYNNFIYYVNTSGKLIISNLSNSYNFDLNGIHSGFSHYKDKLFFSNGNNLYYFCFSDFVIHKFSLPFIKSGNLNTLFLGNLMIGITSTFPTMTVTDCYDVSDFNNPIRINPGNFKPSYSDFFNHPTENNIFVQETYNTAYFYYVGIKPYNQSGMFDNNGQLVNNGYLKYNIRNMFRPVSVLGNYKS